MNWKPELTVAVANLVPVTPAFEAASTALKGDEAYALKEATSTVNSSLSMLPYRMYYRVAVTDRDTQ